MEKAFPCNPTVISTTVNGVKTYVRVLEPIAGTMGTDTSGAGRMATEVDKASSGGRMAIVT